MPFPPFCFVFGCFVPPEPWLFYYAFKTVSAFTRVGLAYIRVCTRGGWGLSISVGLLLHKSHTVKCEKRREASKVYRHVRWITRLPRLLWKRGGGGGQRKMAAPRSSSTRRGNYVFVYFHPRQLGFRIFDFASTFLSKITRPLIWQLFRRPRRKGALFRGPCESTDFPVWRSRAVIGQNPESELSNASFSNLIPHPWVWKF